MFGVQESGAVGMEIGASWRRSRRGRVLHTALGVALLASLWSGLAAAETAAEPDKAAAAGTTAAGVVRPDQVVGRYLLRTLIGSRTGGKSIGDRASEADRELWVRVLDLNMSGPALEYEVSYERTGLPFGYPDPNWPQPPLPDKGVWRIVGPGKIEIGAEVCWFSFVAGRLVLTNCGLAGHYKLDCPLPEYFEQLTDIMERGCSKNWRLLWSHARTGDSFALDYLTAGSFWGLGVLPGTLRIFDRDTARPAHEQEQLRRVDHVLSLSLYSWTCRSRFTAVHPMLPGVMASRCLESLRPGVGYQEIADCLAEEADDPACLNRAIDLKLALSFADYVKLVDGLMDDSAHCPKTNGFYPSMTTLCRELFE